MLAVASTTIAVPPAPTLVATPLPGTIAARVPYDNVVPSVSNARVDNNASGNRNPLPKAELQAAAVQTASAEETFSLPASTPSQGLNTSTQTAFLAQLTSQDASPAARVILVQYEKLVSYGTVKYKPSDAGKPTVPTDLSHLFSQALHEEKAPERAAPAAQKTAVKIDAPTEAPAEVSVTASESPQQPAEEVKFVPASLPPAPKATAAYSETIRRNNDAERETTLESA